MCALYSIQLKGDAGTGGSQVVEVRRFLIILIFVVNVQQMTTCSSQLLCIMIYACRNIVGIIILLCMNIGTSYCAVVYFGGTLYIIIYTGKR